MISSVIPSSISGGGSISLKTSSLPPRAIWSTKNFLNLSRNILISIRYQVRPANPELPTKFETGTLNQEGLAGTTAAIDYLAALGRQYGQQFADKLSNYEGRRKELKQAMQAIRAYERSLFTYLMAELQTIPGIRIYGITKPEEFQERCPTVAFTRESFTPAQLAAYLGERNIFVWDGNYYALSVTERLGVEETGGMVRAASGPGPAAASAFPVRGAGRHLPMALRCR